MKRLYYNIYWLTLALSVNSHLIGREALPLQVNADQVATFLERWPVCKENEKTQEACDKAKEKLGYTSPRIKHDAVQIVRQLQPAAQLVTDKPEAAQKRTEEDLAGFLTVEYSVDSLKNFDEKKYPELAKFYKKYGLPHVESTWMTQN